ncbi:MAG TPA: hypothetical protein VHY91_12225 [Pirellulales bacterium]|nr:hypothetical protein [Pirellulales bacterium]
MEQKPVDTFMTDWPFEDPRNVAIITVRQIVREGAPILYVTHDADDGAWQFLPGFDVVVEDALVLALSEIVDLDPSVADLANLPFGWEAHRSCAGDPWTRKPRPWLGPVPPLSD